MPRPQRRSTYHHGNLREALIEAAVAMLAEVGPEALSLRELARRVGVDHRAVYRHFEDKDALLAGLAEEGFRTLLEKSQRAMGRLEGSHERLQALMRTYVLFAAANPAHYRVMMGPRLNEAGRFPQLEAVVSELFGLAKTEIARGVGASELTANEEQETAIGLWAVVHGLSSLVLLRRIRVSPKHLTGLTERVVARTLRGIVRTG